MTAIHFFTLKEAAAAVAAQLQPHDATKQAEQAERYWHMLYRDVCSGTLVGRDPDGRDPIHLGRIGAVLHVSICVLSESDLNGWLQRLGNGVKVTNIPQEQPAPKLGPTTREFVDLAEAYLCSGFGREELMKLLGNAKDDKRLNPLRTLGDDGQRARWNQPAKLVLELVARNKIMEQSARQLVEEHFPDHIGDFGTRPGAPRTATWVSVLQSSDDPD